MPAGCLLLNFPNSKTEFLTFAGDDSSKKACFGRKTKFFQESGELFWESRDWGISVGNICFWDIAESLPFSRECHRISKFLRRLKVTYSIAVLFCNIYITSKPHMYMHCKKQ